MKLSSPLPQPLPKECLKAAKIFISFVDRSNNGLDGVIPHAVLEQAKGFAIFSIFKAGFLFSARAGSGVVIARLDNGTWSAPSAIGLAGLGLGGQVGAEMTDFLIVLNSHSAVKSFMAAGSLTLGGNLSVAVGPLGRTGEASGSVNSSGNLAAMYSYSKTRGLFGGISIEGSVIVERQDANALAYGSDVKARSLLSGNVEPPEWASGLIKTIQVCTGAPYHKWVNDSASDPGYLFKGAGSTSSESASGSNQTPKRGRLPSFPPLSWSQSSSSVSYSDADPHIPPTSWTVRQPESTFAEGSMNSSVTSRSPPLPGHSSQASPRYITPKPELVKPLLPHEGIARAIALYDFKAIEPEDLSFSKGDVVIITKKTEEIDDWWTGKVGDKEGIFPANYVEVV